MSRDEYKKLITEMVADIDNTNSLISIYSFTKVKFEKEKEVEADDKD